MHANERSFYLNRFKKHKHRYRICPDFWCITSWEGLACETFHRAAWWGKAAPPKPGTRDTRGERDTAMLITLNQVIHTTWCELADSTDFHPKGGECEVTRSIRANESEATVTLQGLPFDSQVVKVVDCNIFDANDGIQVSMWLSDTIRELSEMMDTSLAWENVAERAASDQIDALQATI